jgi:RecB family exonuclease
MRRELAGEGEEEQPDWVRERIEDVDRLARFIADLDERLRSHPDRAPWSEQLDFLQDLLARYVKGADEVVEALRGLERFVAIEQEVPFERFLEVVRRAIETLRSEDVLEGQPGAFARRGVNVVAVNSLPGIEFSRLWILGATERSFPPPARQDPILLDTERKTITERTGLELAPRAERGSEEALQFALACEAARERLVVSYARRATGEARPRLPSLFFRELASQLEGRRVSAEEAPLLHRDDVQRIPGDAIGAPIPGGRYADDRKVVSDAAQTAVSEADRDRTYLQASITQPLAVAILERAAPAFGRARAARDARRSRRYSEWDGALSERALEAAAVLVRPDRVYSPSSLEGYAVCPQRFLMGDLLRIKALEEPERTVRIDALRRGNLFHKIFERLWKEWKGPGPAALDPGAAERLRKIANDECDAAEARGETGYPAMWAADRLEVIDDCLRWLERERQDPDTIALPEVATEARFGQRWFGEQKGSLSRDEPIVIELNGRTFALAGRIDRINWNADKTRFRVIDYKTGKLRSEKPGVLQGGRMLQLPLYVLAGAELLGTDTRGGEAAYAYPTRRGQFRTIPWTGEDLAQRQSDLVRVLTGILDAIARGDFMVAPWKVKEACRHCDFNEVCPRPRESYIERKQGDPRLAPFAENVRGIE